MKPPARDIAIDAVEDLWRNCKAFSTQIISTSLLTKTSDDDAKPSAAKLLTKWRPQVLEEKSANGVSQEIPAQEIKTS